MTGNGKVGALFLLFCWFFSRVGLQSLDPNDFGGKFLNAY